MKDVKRTLPNEEYFRKDYNLKKLKNIIIALSNNNKKLGYT